jgi:hypothetical protein
MLPLLRISCARRALTPPCGHASPRSSSSAQGAQVTPSCLPFTSWVLRMERDLVVLLSLQCEDGGWEPSWVYKHSSLGLKLGNSGLMTALTLNAITALYSRVICLRGASALG